MKKSKTMRTSRPARASARPVAQRLTRSMWTRLAELSDRLRARDEKVEEKRRKRERFEPRQNASDRRWYNWAVKEKGRGFIGVQYTAQFLRIPEAALLRELRGTPYLLDFGVGARGHRHAVIRFRDLEPIAKAKAVTA